MAKKSLWRKSSPLAMSVTSQRTRRPLIQKTIPRIRYGTRRRATFRSQGGCSLFIAPSPRLKRKFTWGIFCLHSAHFSRPIYDSINAIAISILPINFAPVIRVPSASINYHLFYQQLLFLICIPIDNSPSTFVINLKDP